MIYIYIYLNITICFEGDHLNNALRPIYLHNHRPIVYIIYKVLIRPNRTHIGDEYRVNFMQYKVQQVSQFEKFDLVEMYCDGILLT